MTNKEQQYKTLIKLYDQKRLQAAQQKREREELIYQCIPDIEKIDRSLNQLGIRLIRHSLRSPGEDVSSQYQLKNQDLTRNKKRLLVEHGYPADYLDPIYDCPLCKDTGFINDAPEQLSDIPETFAKSKPCKCFNQALINLAYRQSNLQNVLAHENFSTFDFTYYSPDINSIYQMSPLKNIQNIYQRCISFVENFEYDKRNLLFHGETGLGKTFLCNCIAKEILDLGYSVLYLSAQELFKLFGESRFHREDMEEEALHALDILFTVDLLIIDDFGTEINNTFTAPDLFNVINTRSLNKHSTIISTNLPLKDWQTLYSDRIISRILGSFDNFRIFGEDIRLLKKYHSTRTKER